MLFALKPLCRNRVIAIALALLILNLIPGLVQAHAVGWSYVFITVEETGVTGRLELPIDQLDRVLGLDKDGNGEVSDDEVEAAWDAIEQYAADIVELGTTDLSYSMSFTGRDRLDSAYAQSEGRSKGVARPCRRIHRCRSTKKRNRRNYYSQWWHR